MMLRALHVIFRHFLFLVLLTRGWQCISRSDCNGFVGSKRAGILVGEGELFETDGQLLDFGQALAKWDVLMQRNFLDLFSFRPKKDAL